ncbi:MAG: hypothetical protein GY928_01245 [Colwellia sp.]|nr:hypothetical protein [Colwellia sp.]
MKKYIFSSLITLFSITVLGADTEEASASFTLNSLIENKVLLSTIENINKKYKKQEDTLRWNSKKTIPNNATIEIINSSDVPLGIPEGEELVLAINIDKLFLADIFAYKTKAGAKVSLMSLFEILDFPIELDLDKQIATGWFINENYGFDLNYAKDGGVAIIKGKSFPIKAEHISIEEDDIYVESQILTQWFGLNITFDFSNLIMFINPLELIPVQQRLERKDRKELIKSANESVAPWKESDYEILSSPLFDLQMSHSTDNDNNNFSSYSILGGHDFAYLNAEYYVSGSSQDSINSARLTFSKESDNHDLLGLFKASKFEFGDIRPVSTSINFNNNINRGVSFSQGLSDTNLNNRTNFNGNILPGWDIELYRNGIFIRKQLSLQSGRYEFNDIDLLFGNNIFELISYGPQGQVEKTTKEIYVDGNSLDANESSYGVSLTQTGRSVLGVDLNSLTDNEGWLLAARYSRGFTDWLSINLGHTTLISDNNIGIDGQTQEDEHTLSLGGDLSLFERFLIQVQSEFNEQEDHSLLVTMKTALKNQSFTYSYQEGKVNVTSADDESLTDELISKEHLLTMSGFIYNSNELKVNYQNQYLNKKGNSGAEYELLSNQIGFNAGRFSLQNSLYWQKRGNLPSNNNTSGQFDVDEYISGETSLQRMFGSVFSRFIVGYTFKPESEITTLSTEVSWSLLENIQSNIKVDYFKLTDRYQAQLGLNWQQDAYNINSTLRFDDQNDWRVGINFRFSFGYQLDKNEFMFSSTPITNKGALMVRVFEDDNLNGIYDEGENLIEGAKVKSLQNYTHGISNPNGIAVIKNLPNQKITDIELDKNSLGDGFLLPSKGAVAITPRKGYLGQLDFPVVTSSEVEGNIYLTADNGDFEALAYVTIHLVDIEGNIVKTTRSEYDGYYLFVDLLPGQYFVVIDDNYLAKRKLRNIDNIPISLTAQGDVINGSDFTLEELEFSKGFIVKAGEFSSLKMLQAYWYLIKKRYRVNLKQKVFYIEDKDTKKFQLNLGFYQQETESISACEKIATMKINCTVESFEFGF